MNHGAYLNAAGLTALLTPDNELFLKVAAGFSVVILGFIAIVNLLNRDQGKARFNLLTAFGLIVLITIISPLDWLALLS